MIQDGAVEQIQFKPYPESFAQLETENGGML